MHIILHSVLVVMVWQVVQGANWNRPRRAYRTISFRVKSRIHVWCLGETDEVRNRSNDRTQDGSNTTIGTSAEQQLKS